MILDKTAFLSAVRSLQEKATTQEEAFLLSVLQHIVNDMSKTDYDFVDIEDQNKYILRSCWTGPADVLEAIEQYFDDEGVFDNFDDRMNACEKIASTIDWDSLGYDLNCKGYDVICQAVEAWLDSFGEAH